MEPREDYYLVERFEEDKKKLQNKIKAKIERAQLRKIYTTITVVLLLATGLVAWIYGRNAAKQRYQSEIADLVEEISQREQEIEQLRNEPILVNAVAPEIVLDILHSQISEISELATAEYMFTDAAKFSDSKQIKNWDIGITEKSFIMKWSGTIKAGIDLEKIDVRVENDEQKIVITLPNAEILSYEVDQDSVEVLEEKNNIFNRISVNDKIKFDAACEEAMKERAIENGILDKALKYAENIIEQLLRRDGTVGTEYTIEFEIAQ